MVGLGLTVISVESVAVQPLVEVVVILYRTIAFAVDVLVNTSVIVVVAEGVVLDE